MLFLSKIFTYESCSFLRVTDDSTILWEIRGKDFEISVTTLNLGTWFSLLTFADGELKNVG